MWDITPPRAFARLASDPNHQKRGRKLEDLLAILFERNQFRVERNPGISRPRQTDLLARHGGGRLSH